MRNFYIVLNINIEKIEMIITDKAEAEKVAEELAIKYPTETFYVLAVIGSCSSSAVQWDRPGETPKP